MTNFDLIKKPLLTEKASLVHEKANQVVFVVAKSANKIEIKETVEKAFKVKVLDVNTSNVKSKKKRMGRHLGKTGSWKKAVVTLKEGDSIEYFQGA